MRVKMSKQPPPAPTASAVGPCPTVIQIVGPPPGTGSLPSTIAPPDHPRVRHKSDSNFASPVWLGTCAVNCCIAWQQMRTDANTYSFSYSREYSIHQTSALKLISPPPQTQPLPRHHPAHHPRYFSYIISQLNLDFTFINRRGATRWRVCT